MRALRGAAARERAATALIAARAAALLCCATLTWSCAAQAVTGFTWLDQDGEETPFAQSERRSAGKEGLFEGAPSANRYIPSSPIAMRGGRAIAVDIELDPATANSREARVTLGASSEPDGDPALLEATFPILETSARLYLRLKAGARVASVSVKSAGKGSFRIRGISMPPAMAGMKERKGGLSVTSGFRLAIGQGTRELAIERPFEGLVPASTADRPGLILSYGPSAAGGREGPIAIEAAREGGGIASMTLGLGPGSRSTALGAELFPEDTKRITARAPEGRSIGDFYSAELAPTDFEPADLGRILASGPPRSGEDYVLYRWDALPSVIVLVFRDYGAQDRYLKRLAFFVEKAGYRGKLQPDAVIEPLHGWNAHDYRPEDLAAFFEKARAEDFPLSAEERSLGKLLAEKDLVRESGGKIRPGNGALISASLESAPALRRTLLVHESTHAIFFADEEYRNLVRRTWSSIGEDEKWFWKAYFAWAMYDTGSDYLMANEFQAYLLQQPVSAAREYFTKRKPDELLAKHPELAPKVEAYMEKYAGSFEARAGELEAWLERNYGFTAGRTYFLDFER
jgi:hypothetical protein